MFQEIYKPLTEAEKSAIYQRISSEYPTIYSQVQLANLHRAQWDNPLGIEACFRVAHQTGLSDGEKVSKIGTRFRPILKTIIDQINSENSGKKKSTKKVA